MNSYLTEDLDPDGLLIVTLADPSGPLNRTTDQFKAELAALLDRLEAAPPKGVILRTDRDAFGVGGDVDQIAALAAAGVGESFADSQRIKALFRRIESLPLPVVCLIEGMAVGGSFELALACHAVFARADARIRLGFPECSIGLVPGAGGLLRCVHLLGEDAARSLIVDATLIAPDRALELGLVTGLAENRDALMAAARAWIAENATPARPWDRKRHKVPGGGPYDRRGRYLARQGHVSGLVKRGHGRQMARITALSAICDVAACGFADGALIESRAFARQATSAEARACIGLEIKDKSVLKRAPSRPQGVPAQVLPTRVGILGAGLMGAGIAFANARAGYPVALADVTREAADRGMAQVRADVDRALRRSQMTAAEGAALLARVTPGVGTAHLAGCDLMIEAVTEDIGLKQRVLREMETLLPPEGRLASNTSALSITGIAQALARPEAFLGLHFFSPVDRMHLVEIVVGARTGDAMLALAHDYSRSLRKQPITVADSHGFFASRVFQKFIYEAAALVGEGVPAALIENAALQAGYPAGPLSLIDDTALTLSLKVIDHAAEAAIASGHAPENHPGEAIIRTLALDHGREGRRAGAGFYDYTPTGKFPWPGLADLASRRLRPTPAPEEIAERYLTAQCCDVLRCLAAGVIRSSAEVNAGAIRAIGFPAWTGGPLRLIAEEGAAPFLARSRALADRHGARFALPFTNTDALAALLDRAETFDTEPAMTQG
ncbi:3-hydroxyacyl-CoA dehydrogenase NAD-binding domain-containing protein [Pseudooceanicola aestuarii]|uniref:3-hydroxyacyl-CoA dehydrogenase NAD-binding domain-containing protein n=1 Tax=Pseudooceanicola aestuarii TaxID=2697319 RepID=UPI0013D2A33E|nr:3-hydroxyacyl-CoA dehydrogenase NAD-binding domain-containing protein [Pseudooceanicola aestuarii]